MIIKRLTALVLTSFISSPLLAKFGQSEFKNNLNKVRAVDPYYPRLRGGNFALGLRAGNHALNSLFDPDESFFRYFTSRKFELYVRLPQNDPQEAFVGGEYRLRPVIGSRDWFGMSYRPETSQAGLHFRGIQKTNRVSKIHYNIDALVGSELSSISIGLGFFANPFISTINSFWDTRVAALYGDGIDITQQKWSAFTELGHRFPNFALVKGLELLASIGIGYSAATQESPLPDREFSNSEANLRLIIGFQYYYM